MQADICFYTGSAAAFNVQQTLLNLGRMLSGQFTLHHVTTCPDMFSGEHETHFTVHSPSDRDGHLGGAVALYKYLTTHTPSVLTQVGRVPVHGNVISLLKDSDTTFVCRYSGDLFYEYSLETGAERAKRYLINNGLGRVPLVTADKTIAMGPREKRRIVERGFNPADTVVLPPPINKERFEDTETHDISLSSDRQIVLFVGRVSELKGASTLEQTIPKILEQRQDLQFVFLGDQQYEFNLPPEIAEHVTFEGRVPPSRVPAYMDAADLYVHPSLTEGISRSVIEALMSGTPVIARDVGDLASATSNIFLTDDDFVRMVVDFERFPVDDPMKFDVANLHKPYTTFFEECVESRWSNDTR